MRPWGVAADRLRTNCFLANAWAVTLGPPAIVLVVPVHPGDPRRQPGHKAAWYRLEVAKRRLLYSLLHLGLPLTPKSDDPAHGLAYEFLYPVDAGD